MVGWACRVCAGSIEKDEDGKWVVDKRTGQCTAYHKSCYPYVELDVPPEV